MEKRREENERVALEPKVFDKDTQKSRSLKAKSNFGHAATSTSLVGSNIVHAKLPPNFRALINVILSDFAKDVNDASGAEVVVLAIENRSSKIIFFIVDVDVSYNLLLSRDWIHMNQCVPSSLHQTSAFCNGDKVEYVRANHYATIS